MTIENLGIQRVDHVDFVVHDIARSRGFYGQKMDMALTAQSDAAFEEEFGETSLLFEAARSRIRVTAPTRSDSHAGKFLRHHPDGVRTVAFRVESVDHAYKVLGERNANLIDEPWVKDGYKQFHIASPLGDVEYAFVEKKEGATDPHLTPVAGSSAVNRHAFTHMDHITSNTRDLHGLVNWYRDVLGFEHFWDIRFHTQDSNPEAVGSGLNSIVMRDPKSNVKFATNEPLSPNFYGSQIQKYVEDNGGPGVQHIALSTSQIMDTVPQMQKAGLQFLDTPASYYEMLPERMAERAVENLKEDIEELQKRKILVDGRDNRYLLQIFMKEASLLYNEAAAGPFFYEVIQRHGEQGFGEGNFRALFESIERQQVGETSRTVENPQLND